MLQDEATPSPIRIEPYDPSWPACFEREREVLQAVIGAWLAGPIEHIGSTAVPGLAAKPVIDIIVAVESLAASRSAIPALQEAGYSYAPYRGDVMHWLCKPSPTVRTHHLHLVPFGDQQWSEELAFRDYLRANAAIAHDYGELKQRLAEQFPFDRDAYTEHKEPFVRRVLALAVAGRASSGR